MVTIVLVPDPALPPTILDDGEIARTAAALQAWINHEVAPAWSQGPYTVIAVPRGKLAPRGADRRWLVHLRTNSDVPGAAGYHTLDTAACPVAHVFVTDAALLGLRWTAVAGHEIAEMMVNRWCSAAVLAGLPGVPSVGLAACTMEACDPCEIWSYDFTWEGARYAVPDFVLPSYFRPNAYGPYDRMGQVPGPLQPARGCRQSYAPLSSAIATTIGASPDPDAGPKTPADEAGTATPAIQDALVQDQAPLQAASTGTPPVGVRRGLCHPTAVGDPSDTGIRFSSFSAPSLCLCASVVNVLPPPSQMASLRHEAQQCAR